MSTCQDTTGRCLAHSFYCICISMPPVNTSQGFITSAFDPIFYHEKRMFVQFFQITQQTFRHTIGTRTNHQPDYPIHRQCFLILTLQAFQLRICIGVGLKIGQIFHFRIFMGKKAFPFFQLGSDRLLCPAVIRIKSLVIAICTSAPSFCSVTIRTSETCVQ